MRKGKGKGGKGERVLNGGWRMEEGVADNIYISAIKSSSGIISHVQQQLHHPYLRFFYVSS